MRRIAIVVAGVIALVLVVTQIALPPLLARHVGSQLTAHGGQADVKLSAVPALRLLFDEGSSVKVRATGLNLGLVSPSQDVLGKLDGFDNVDVQLSRSTSGPFTISSAHLRRSGGHPYTFTVSATANGGALSQYAGSQVGGALGGLVGSLAGGVLGLDQTTIPLDVTALVSSDNGRPVVANVRGSVAGIPAGPLIQLIAAALVNPI